MSPVRGSIGLAVLALALTVLSLRAFAQESQSQEPSPQDPSSPAGTDSEQSSEPAEEASPDPNADPDDVKLSIEEMKALSDSDLRVLYIEAPWRLPENFGDDSELLDRVMGLVHPEMEPESELSEHPEHEETAEPTPKPKPDAR